MKAIGYYQSLPIDNEQSLIDLDIPKPTPGPHDLFVNVRAISVNPVDTKVRKRTAGSPGNPKILGWDVAGVVESVGSEASLFRPSDEVFYAGTIARPGADSEFHVVDERLVGPKPKSLSFADAAAMPLTSITAWELLFDRLRVPQKNSRNDKSNSGAPSNTTQRNPALLNPAAPSDAAQSNPTALLIVGGAGGVGSILIQLARQLTDTTVIATASRPETRKWCLDLGAHEVIDHSKPMAPQIKSLGSRNASQFPPVLHIAALTHTGKHWDDLVEILAPQGLIGAIDDPGPVDIMKLKPKCAGFVWEFMFARAVHQTPDMIQQHRLLSDISKMIDDKTLKATTGEVLGKIDAANLREAHRRLESGKTIGKLVLEGF